MQRYVEQLIEDIRLAKKRPRPPKMELPPELEMFRGAEEYLHGEYYEMGALFGLNKEQFPPIEKLSSNEIELLAYELEKLWQAFNFYPVFPDNLPANYRYNLLVAHLDYKTTYVSVGHNNFEFCYYDASDCPFPSEFCSCKDFDNEDYDDVRFPDDTTPQNDNLPF